MNCLRPTTYVSYKIIGKNNEILSGRENSACYSSITYGKLPKETTKIICYHHIDSTPYTPEEVKRWIKEVKSFGFPCKNLGLGCQNFDISDEYHVVEIPIKIRDKVYYDDKNHLTSVLQLVRYLFENGLFKLPRVYFEALDNLLKEYKRIDRFKLMQLSHGYISGNSNHSLRNFDYKKTITKKEFLRRCERKYSIYNQEYPSISELWNDISFFKSIEKIENRYKKSMEKIRKVYVVGGNNNYANWLKDFKPTNNIEVADLVLFTGGEDVSPSFYEEEKHPYTSNNLHRDIYEKTIWDKATELNLPKLGICRGSQFLCVMNGGKLVQHQENPHSIHEMELYNGKKIHISSTHHQAAFPYNLKVWDYKILGWTTDISKIHQNGKGEELSPLKECEIVYYPKSYSLGIQGHPEFSHYQKEHPESLKELQTIFENFINRNL